jgi:hypothetical protein
MTQIKKITKTNQNPSPIIKNDDALQPAEVSETPTKPKTLTPKELNDLAQSHENLNQVNSDLKSICYNKEVFLRKFNRQYDSLSLSQEQLERQFV